MSLNHRAFRRSRRPRKIFVLSEMCFIMSIVLKTRILMVSPVSKQGGILGLFCRLTVALVSFSVISTIGTLYFWTIYEKWLTDSI